MNPASFSFVEKPSYEDQIKEMEDAGGIGQRPIRGHAAETFEKPGSQHHASRVLIARDAFDKIKSRISCKMILHGHGQREFAGMQTNQNAHLGESTSKFCSLCIPSSSATAQA